MASSTTCLPGTVSCTPACAFDGASPLEAGASTAQGGMSPEEAARGAGRVLQPGARFGIISVSNHEDGDFHR
jgi:hypothetical protein